MSIRHLKTLNFIKGNGVDYNYNYLDEIGAIRFVGSNPTIQRKNKEVVQGCIVKHGDKLYRVWRITKSTAVLEDMKNFDNIYNVLKSSVEVVFTVGDIINEHTITDINKEYDGRFITFGSIVLRTEYLYEAIKKTKKIKEPKEEITVMEVLID